VDVERTVEAGFDVLRGVGEVGGGVGKLVDEGGVGGGCLAGGEGV
jgi:hypothetical protein